jgi:hypothetical protein
MELSPRERSIARSRCYGLEARQLALILFVNKRLRDFALVENALGVDYSALTVPVLLVAFRRIGG